MHSQHMSQGVIDLAEVQSQKQAIVSCEMQHVSGWPVLLDGLEDAWPARWPCMPHIWVQQGETCAQQRCVPA